MCDTAASHDDRRTPHLIANADPSADGGGVNAAGMIAAAVWAVGLVTGVIALITGHVAVAVVALVLAVASPWVGLAWISRSRPVERPAPLSSASHGMRFIAR